MIPKFPTYEMIEKYYKKGYYTNYHLKEYCRMGYLTEQEYFVLTGLRYWEDIEDM